MSKDRTKASLRCAHDEAVCSGIEDALARAAAVIITPHFHDIGAIRENDGNQFGAREKATAWKAMIVPFLKFGIFPTGWDVRSCPFHR